MPAMAQYHNMPLPKGWPRRVRSAVIQVISLARFSLTTTRSWAAHSWNARVRLKQENDRLQQELALLFSEFVGYIVRRLKILCPTLGRVKIAQILFRAGLHLGSTTVRRMLRDSPRQGPLVVLDSPVCVVAASSPNHVWHVDLTTVPTSLGFWTAWLPFALPQRWPFCWWLAVAFDHFSRRLMGFTVFKQQPDSSVVRAFLARTLFKAAAVPKYLISDQGKQLTAGALRDSRHKRRTRSTTANQVRALRGASSPERTGRVDRRARRRRPKSVAAVASI